MGPDQLKAAAEALVAACRAAAGLAQLSCAGVTDTEGSCTWLLTTVVAVATQPFALLSTCSVYVPAALTVGVRVVAPATILPPLEAVHRYVMPRPEEEPAPLSTAVGCPQLITAEGAATATGGAIFSLTCTLAVRLQLFTSVTVTV